MYQQNASVMSVRASVVTLLCSGDCTKMAGSTWWLLHQHRPATFYSPLRPGADGLSLEYFGGCGGGGGIIPKNQFSAGRCLILDE